MENYLKVNNIDHITGDPYNSQHQWAVKTFNYQDFLFQLRISREKFCIVDSINDP